MSEHTSPIIRTLETNLDERFGIMAGFTERLAKQLVIKSQEQLISAANPADATERFSSLGAFNRWERAGQRVVYMLTNAEQTDLGGLAWYEPARLPRVPQIKPTPNHVLGIRLYQGYNNQRLAQPLMAATLRDYIGESDNGVNIADFGGVWLNTSAASKPAVRAYQRFGFETVADDKGRLTMVLSPERLPRALSSVG